MIHILYIQQRIVRLIHIGLQVILLYRIPIGIYLPQHPLRRIFHQRAAHRKTARTVGSYHVLERMPHLMRQCTIRIRLGTAGTHPHHAYPLLTPAEGGCLVIVIHPDNHLIFTRMRFLPVYKFQVFRVAIIESFSLPQYLFRMETFAFIGIHCRVLSKRLRPEQYQIFRFSHIVIVKLSVRLVKFILF